MLTTIKGTYNNGIVTLNEQAPTVETTQVFVVFTEESGLIAVKKNTNAVANIFADCRVSLTNFIFNRDKANDYND